MLVRPHAQVHDSMRPESNGAKEPSGPGFHRVGNPIRLECQSKQAGRAHDYTLLLGRYV
jgi:hypothetical protein